MLALDWGSSQLRAWRVGADGRLLEQRSSADGASRIRGGAAAFEAALRSLVGDWIAQQPEQPLIACGMVGSAHGWREAPYLACPVALAQLHRHLIVAEGPAGLRLHIVPGLKTRDAQGLPDVMRGEETQLAGLLALRPDLAGEAMVLMPGTHSKWVRLSQGRVEHFATRMTGELFALLREHSVLAKTMAAPRPGDGFDAAAFDRGVAAAREAGGADLGRLLFGVRTLALFGELAREAAADHLSGLLIGAELASALPNASAQAPYAWVLVGEHALCSRYARALRAWDRVAAVADEGLAAAGLVEVARAAGLIIHPH